MMEKAATSGQFTGWHMLFSIVAFFAVIIGVNVFMAFSATSTWTGLVVQNSYVASQQFNTKLANARQQAEWGWQGALALQGDALVFSLTDDEGQAITTQAVTVELSRPIGTIGDQTIELASAGDGTWRADVALRAGIWNATILATFEDLPDYEHRARLLAGGAE